MTKDIKAIVAELERVRQEIRGEPIEQAKAGFYTVLMHQAIPSLLAELRRLWAIEEAARKYRGITHDLKNHSFADIDESFDALKAALRTGKTGGEEKP